MPSFVLRPGSASGDDRDAELVARSRGGDMTAFADLVREHEGRVYGIVYQYVRDDEDAEDITREVFYKAFRSLGRFRGNSKFSSWVCRIAINRSIDYLRRRKNIRVEPLDQPIETGTGGLERDFPDGALSPAEEAERTELAGMIAAAVDRLSPKLRTVTILREYQDLSIEEIADVLGVSQGTVKSRIFRARERLRAMLGPYVEGSEQG